MTQKPKPIAFGVGTVPLTLFEKLPSQGGGGLEAPMPHSLVLRNQECGTVAQLHMSLLYIPHFFILTQLVILLESNSCLRGKAGSIMTQAIPNQR